MSTQFLFTTPTGDVQQARLAMARLRARLTLDIDPLEPCADQGSLALAFMALEDVRPAYPPLPDGITASDDGAADHALAVRLLTAAMHDAPTAVEILRYAFTIRHLRELNGSPYVAPATSAHSRETAEPK